MPEIVERSLQELSADLAAGGSSSVDLLRQYAQRIETLDRQGPRLTSVIEMNPDALAIALKLDAERRAGKVRSPLHGLPILLKDNIASADLMATTAGSLAMLGARAPEDAALVRRLRAAGALVMGKTNLSEWANARGSGSSSGWSARGGLTRNPYALDRSASGSSSGSAVAVAASLCAAAVGTETDASILSPAAVCGIVGLKPTVGLISRQGIIPLAQSQDTAGPMARSVRDCAMLLDALAGPDPADPATLRNPRHRANNYAAALDAGALKGARLGVLRQFFVGPQAPAYEAALAALRRAGAVLVDPLQLPDLALLREHERTLMLHELKAGLNDYLRWLGPDSPVRCLADVIAFNQRHAASELAWFGQDRLELAQTMGDLNHPAYLAARNACLHLTSDQGIEALLLQHRLDALIAPTTGPAWRVQLGQGDPAMLHSCSFAAVAGTPGITVPAASWRGLPLGLSFYAAAWSEQKLLNLGHAFEQATQARQRPGYFPCIEDSKE